jgi:hypothetical protein
MHNKYSYLTLLSLVIASYNLQGQIAIGDNLSLEGASSVGFISTQSSTSGNTNEIDIQELLLELSFDHEKVSTEIEMNLSNGTMEINVAQVSYTYNDALTFSAGRFDSLLFYEDNNITKRLNYSQAQGLLPEIVPFISQGVRGMANTEKGWLGLSWTDLLWDEPADREGSLNGGSGATEAQIGYRPLEGLEVAVSFGGQDSGDTGPNGTLWDVWLSYQKEKYLFVAEYVDFENTGAQDTDGIDGFANSEYLTGKTWMLLGSLDIGENGTLTARYSQEDQVSGGDSSKWTLTRSHAFGDNLSGRLEFSRDDRKYPAEPDEVIKLLSLEGIFRF